MSDDEATADNESRPAVGAPVEPSVRPCAWADDKVMAGQVGNCASDAAKTYWQRSNQFDRMMAERLTHPLYTEAQVRATRLAERERCAALCDGLAKVMTPDRRSTAEDLARAIREDQP